VTKTARRAIITGIAGQDGSYLAELLLSRGYRVTGIVRETTSTHRIDHLVNQVELRSIDLLDDGAIGDLLRAVRPHEVYNLAGQSFVPTSRDATTGLTATGAAHLLGAIADVDRRIRFYQASSSEIFGNAPAEPQSEQTPPNPRNPYGQAKAAAHAATRAAREELGLFAVSGILYNHESPRRGFEFVSRKISDGVARISLGLADTLPLGSLEAQRDWGYAGDYVRAMWLMLQQDVAADYVIASGVPHAVRDMCRIAFDRVGLDYRRYVTVDASLVRAPEAVRLIGDSSRARRELDWQPAVSFEDLIAMMVDADIARLRGGAS
jgi:GDPmannose 4,6-dehydratase